MKTLKDILANDKTQTRRNAIQFARENNYKVRDMFELAASSFLNLMAEIHSNGKEGDYDTATQCLVVKETLSTWV